MNDKWKRASMQELIKYNRYLLISLVCLSVMSVMLCVKAFSQEQRYVLIPMSNIEKHMEVSDKKLYPSYLAEWAKDISTMLFTTTPDLVARQMADVRKVSASNIELEKFLEGQQQFVQGSTVSCVFYPKKTEPVDGGVVVHGTFHYWFGNKAEKVSMEKKYLLSYEDSGRGLILLSGVEEIKKDKRK